MNQQKTNDEKTETVESLKTRCPLPSLLEAMKLGQYAKSSCKSPLRPDSNPSWGIYEHEAEWYWKDHGNEDHGDEFTFLARFLGLDQQRDFLALLKIYQNFARQVGENPKPPATKWAREKPDRAGYRRGTADELKKLSDSRGISIQALELAMGRGLLVFGQWCGLEVYGVTDQSGNVLELRRLNGEMFPAFGSLSERKSHAVKGSQKNWPVGILEAQAYPVILLVEGIPDFLAAHQIIILEQATTQVAPVAMLSAAAQFSPESLAGFKGKHVRIVPHVDEAGVGGASRWAKQLKEAGAAKVDFLDLGKFEGPGGSKFKDLCEFNCAHSACYPTQSNEWRVSP